ncbi:hypothetical protein DH2020_037080 [Rehmannia glutinosa]|uniref:NAC domain-containing protein n=1 Tax=Rehmannia glutinosa TaxID=99300 RepID=A0ABR0V519_REHGL
MGKFSDFKRTTNGDEPIELPPGFRFHPTDEELISHYLSPKVLDRSFSTIAIGEVDLNKNEWVISRIFKKTSGGKTVHISGLVRGENCSDDSFTSGLPQLMDFSSDKNNIDTTIAAEGSHVTCFSNPIEDTRDTSLDDFICAPDSIFPSQNNSDTVITQDQSILRFLRDNNVTNMKQHVKAEYSKDMSSALSYYDEQEFPIISSDPVDLDCLWNY